MFGRRTALALALGVFALGLGHARASESHASRGTIKSIAPDRAKLSIAHEDIPGYMRAMTMSFVPRTPSQLDGLAIGDRVRFTFVETDDGDRMLTEISRVDRE